MPTYDYVCKNCDKTFEEFHGMNESPKVMCPSCGSRKTEKLIGAGAGLIFKGSGFYITDYKRNNGSDGSKSSGAVNGASKSDSTGSATEKSKETKSAVKTD